MLMKAIHVLTVFIAAVALTLTGWAMAMAVTRDAGVSPDKASAPCVDGSRSALVLRAVDGDTLDLNIDVGFDLTLHTHARILGVNCPEVRGPTKPAGDKATAFTRAYLEKCNSKVSIVDKGPDKYGRRLLLVNCAGFDLATELLKSGNTVPYNP